MRMEKKNKLMFFLTVIIWLSIVLTKTVENINFNNKVIMRIALYANSSSDHTYSYTLTTEKILYAAYGRRIHNNFAENQYLYSTLVEETGKRRLTEEEYQRLIDLADQLDEMDVWPEYITMGGWKVGVSYQGAKYDVLYYPGLSASDIRELYPLSCETLLRFGDEIMNLSPIRIFLNDSQGREELLQQNEKAY